MTSRQAEVAVIGLGAMGSATTYHLAKRGVDVVGFDRFAPPHDRGSSHGGSRIIRQCYFEDPAFVPLALRAYGLWDELSNAHGRPVWRKTGGLLIGPPDGEVVPGVREAARLHRLEHEDLSAADVARRFPAFQMQGDMEAVFEPNAGAVFPEEAIAAHLEQAKRAGARLHPANRIHGWRSTADGVVIETEQGKWRSDRLVLTTGAWTPRLLPLLAARLDIERQVQFFMHPDGAPDRPSDWPIFAIEDSPGKLVYGFPDLGHGVKAAIHRDGAVADPDALDRKVTPDEERALRERLAPHVPSLDVPAHDSIVCMYTNTPDRSFVIDIHPEEDNVILGCGFSGHGFKFAAAIGEALSQLAVDGQAALDLDPFRIDRLLR